MEGNLLSGSDDAQICLWDIAASKGAGRMEAKSIYHEHAGVVEVRQGLGPRVSQRELHTMAASIERCCKPGGTQLALRCVMDEDSSHETRWLGS